MLLLPLSYAIAQRQSLLVQRLATAGDLVALLVMPQQLIAAANQQHPATLRLRNVHQFADQELCLRAAHELSSLDGVAGNDSPSYAR